MRSVLSIRGLTILTLALVVTGPSLLADGGANHRVRNMHFGVSGGNVNDTTRRFCCSGTLGALVQDADGTQYILSNNHVLARSEQAAPGEDVSQPGLIDSNCQISTVVADFTAAPPLEPSNVDAAIAELRPGTMDTSGFIEDIGTISSVPRAATVGLPVAKSGRTTGFTTGTISSINATINVQYQKNCGSGKKFTINYTNQVIISSSTFSAGGDSGSLIVSNNSASCRQPVALLYAGSSTTTIGNPISHVLSALSSTLGSPVSFVGGSCTASASASPDLISDDSQTAAPSSEAIEIATTAMRTRASDLLSRPGIIGVGVAASDTNPKDVTIVVYVDVNSQLSPRVPRRINGVSVKRVFTEPFVAY